MVNSSAHPETDQRAAEDDAPPDEEPALLNLLAERGLLGLQHGKFRRLLASALLRIVQRCGQADGVNG